MYIAVKAENQNKNCASGKYYFHSLHKNVGAYVKEPGPVHGEDYFLVYMSGSWFIQVARVKSHNKLCFLWDKAGGWLCITTKGKFVKMNIIFQDFKVFFSETDPLLLSTEWQEADDEKPWSRKATVKIFSNEEEYNEYQNENKND